MKRAALYQILKPLILFAAIGLALVQGPAFILEAVAQDATPTSIPSPTVAPTSTPTSLPTAGPSPTATSPAGGAGRLVDLQPTDSKTEIDAGECVQFDWRVTDCDSTDSSDPNFCLVDWKIEVEGEDTRLIPVTSFDTRLECPDEDTEYTLIVRWQTPFEEKREEREIEVKTTDGGDGGDGGAPGAPPTPGSFVVVTPILITSSQVIVPPPTATAASVPGQTLPEGVLGTITELPETGFSAANSTFDSEFSARTVSERFQVVTGDFPAVRVVLMLAGLVGGLFLISRTLNR